MRTKTKKNSKGEKKTKIICGTPDNIQDAYREVDSDMQVVWTNAGFWAVPKK